MGGVNNDAYLSYLANLKLNKGDIFLPPTSHARYSVGREACKNQSAKTGSWLSHTSTWLVTHTGVEHVPTTGAVPRVVRRIHQVLANVATNFVGLDIWHSM